MKRHFKSFSTFGWLSFPSKMLPITHTLSLNIMYTGPYPSEFTLIKQFKFIRKLILDIMVAKGGGSW